MTLVIVLNAVLAVLIVSAIVALHTFAILSDRPRRRRPAAVTASSRAQPVRPRPSAPQTGRPAPVRDRQRTPAAAR